MELYQIRYFLAAAETLNFTRASERSYISQPALTKAIQRLEETLGGRLFERSKNAVQLTDLGRAMQPTLRQIFDAANEAREQAKRLTREQKPVVRVGVMCSIDFQQVLPGFADIETGLLAGRSTASVAVELIFQEGNLGTLTDWLDRGDIDIGVMCSPQEMARRFRALPLYAEHYVVAFGDDHRLNGRDGIALAELDREHYCERLDCEFTSHIERLLGAQQVNLVVVQSSLREDWIQALVRANFGIAFMPESLALAAGLAHVRTLDCPIVRQVQLVLQAERPVSPAQQAVIDALQAHDWRRAPA